MTFEDELFEVLRELASTSEFERSSESAYEDMAEYVEDFPDSENPPREVAILVGWVRGAASASELTVRELFDRLDADRVTLALMPNGEA